MFYFQVMNPLKKSKDAHFKLQLIMSGHKSRIKVCQLHVSLQLKSIKDYDFDTDQVFYYIFAFMDHS